MTMEKIDNSAQEEAVKDEAREFMTGLVGTGVGDAVPDAATSSTPEGAAILQSWYKVWKEQPDSNNSQQELMDKFWSLYDPAVTSLWTMVYDEADSNENLDETIQAVKDFLEQPGMPKLAQDGACFGIVHTLETLEMEGIFVFNGPDPEALFGANSESSWYTWSQLGPEATDLVKQAVKEKMIPTDGKLDGKIIKDTQVFCGGTET